MQILICQTCGAVIKGKSKFCTGCGSHVSNFSPSELSPVGAASQPLAVGVALDPVILERIVTRRTLPVEPNGRNGDDQPAAAVNFAGEPDNTALSPSPDVMPVSRLGSIFGSMISPTPVLSVSTPGAPAYLKEEPPLIKEEPFASSYAAGGTYGAKEGERQDIAGGQDRAKEPIQPSPGDAGSYPQENAGASEAEPFGALSRLSAVLQAQLSLEAASQPVVAASFDLDGTPAEQSPEEKESAATTDFLPGQQDKDQSPVLAFQDPGFFAGQQATLGLSVLTAAAPPADDARGEEFSASSGFFQPDLPVSSGPASLAQAMSPDLASFFAGNQGQSLELSNAASPDSRQLPAGWTPDEGAGPSTQVVALARPEDTAISSEVSALAAAVDGQQEKARIIADGFDFFAAGPVEPQQPAIDKPHLVSYDQTPTPTIASPEHSQVDIFIQEPRLDQSIQPAMPEIVTRALQDISQPPLLAPVEQLPPTLTGGSGPTAPALADWSAPSPADMPGFPAPPGTQWPSPSPAPQGSFPQGGAFEPPPYDKDLAPGERDDPPSANAAQQSTGNFFDGQPQSEAVPLQEPKEAPQAEVSAQQAASEKPEDTSQDKVSDKVQRKGRGKGMRDRLQSRESSEAEPEETTGNRILLFLNKEIQIGGKTFSGKVVVVAGVLVLWLGFQIFMGAINTLSAGITGLVTAQRLKQLPPLSGVWRITYRGLDKRWHPGQMLIQQQGEIIKGRGQDDRPFLIGGQINAGANPPTVLLKKQYMVDDKPKGKPVTLSGQLIMKNGVPWIEGQFKAQIRKGYFYKQQILDIQGMWKAYFEAPVAEQPGDGATSIAQGPPQDMPIMDEEGTENKIKGPQKWFTIIAVALIGLGCVLVYFSVKLFGPSGLINIWGKKEYIPSQFKASHSKMLRDLGKPLRAGGLPLGMREDWNILQFDKPKELALTPELREQNPHMLVIGAGAKGKSRLIAKMIAHDIQSNDRAVVVIDSDGGLVDLIVRWISSHPKGKDIAKRVHVIDPTAQHGCLAYNPLEVPEDGDLQSAASAVVFGFKAIYTEPPGSQSQWNQQTANILRNSALLLMANKKTLVDLPTLLSDNDFRDILLEQVERRKHEKVEFITLLETWGQYKRLARTDQWINWVEPILNRVTPMLSDGRIRPILTKPQGDLKLRNIISEGQVLLVKIPQGQLDENANLLGGLLVTGIKQAALALGTKTTRKHPCALYLDEFDNFIEKETFYAITSETKKFQLGFIGACKTLQDLPEDFRNQLLINVGTINAFSLAKKDADQLGPQMFRVDGRKIKHQTLQNIFNKVNTAPQFELITDEEKLNIDRVIGQEERTYFCYRVGTVAGVFHMKAHEFKDVPDKDVNWTLVDQILGAPQGASGQGA